MPRILFTILFLFSSLNQAQAAFDASLAELAKQADCSYRDIDEIRSGKLNALARAYLQEAIIQPVDSPALQALLPDLEKLEKEYLQRLYSPSEAARLKTNIDVLAEKLRSSGEPSARHNEFAIKARPCILAKTGFLQKERLPLDANDQRPDGSQRYRLKSTQDFIEFRPDINEVIVYRARTQFCHDSLTNRLMIERRYFGEQKISLDNMNAIPEERGTGLILDCPKQAVANDLQEAKPAN